MPPIGEIPRDALLMASIHDAQEHPGDARHTVAMNQTETLTEKKRATCVADAQGREEEGEKWETGVFSPKVWGVRCMRSQEGRHSGRVGDTN